MIQNKELYSYIINSIEIMNKSIIGNEQNTVKLLLMSITIKRIYIIK